LGSAGIDAECAVALSAATRKQRPTGATGAAEHRGPSPSDRTLRAAARPLYVRQHALAA